MLERIGLHSGDYVFLRVGYVTTGYPAGYTTAYGQTYPVAGYYLSGR